MRLRWPSLVLPFALAACATAPRATVSDAQIAMLSPERQVEVRRAERQLTDVQAEVAQAEQQRELAANFVTVATSQADAAQSELRAQPIDQAANDRAIAAGKKRQYAERLLALRDAELKLKRDQLSLAKASLELYEVRALHAEGRARDLDEARYADAVARQQRKLDREQQIASDRAVEVSQLRLAWDDHRRAADAAAQRSLEGHQPTTPPLQPLAPATGANEGPSAGFQHLPDDNFAR